MLSKKLLKGLPLWILLIVLVGTASAAFVWISNTLTTTVTVSLAPISWSEGAFTQSVFLGDSVNDVIGYNVNDYTNATGYLFIRFFANDPIGPENVTITEVTVHPDSDIVNELTLVSGYPMNTGPYVLDYLYEQSGGGPFDFSDGQIAVHGIVTVDITYEVTTTLDVSMAVTSTLS
jgi:hypothetical protein